jgi:hypothetical protein
MVRQNSRSVKSKITDFQTTKEQFSGRAGLAPVSRSLDAVGITDILARRFAFLKKNAKGTSLNSIFHQIICYFFDGTDLHMSRFDHLKRDTGYAGVIESEVNNNDADVREGVEPTYKKVKGFQPLQVFWGRYLVDAIFRNGKAHSNHGNHVQRVVSDMVRLIRKGYRNDVPIIFIADTGFFDQVLLEYARPELIIYTNIGMNNEITRSILKAHKSDETEISPQAIINAYHFRARDELVNRALKDFGTEHLPFKRFASNAAFYYLMCISFFLFEAFKYDIDSPAIKITWYAESFRRKVLDSAGQIIRTDRRIFLKLPEVTSTSPCFEQLWNQSGSIAQIPPAKV